MEYYRENKNSFMLLGLFEGADDLKRLYFDVNLYRYPDEDICLFKEFPHRQLVLPFLIGSHLEPTCTSYFLTRQLFNLSPLPIELYADFRPANDWQSCLLIDNAKMQKLCDLDSNMKRCQFHSALEDYASFFLPTSADLLEQFKLALLVFSLFILPLVCTFSVITNTITLIILAQESMLKDPLSPYFRLNTLFNLLLSFLFFGEMFVLCLGEHSLFCSALWRSSFGQYFKIVGLGFLRNSLKFACSFSLILLSAKRLELAGAKQMWLVRLLTEPRLNRLASCLFIFGMGLSIVELFKYKHVELDRFSDTQNQLPQLNNFLISTQLHGIPSAILDKTSVLCYLAFQAMNIIIGNILAFLINGLLDYKLVKQTLANVRSKRELLKHDQSARKLEKLKKAEQTAHKVSKLLFINSCGNLLLRAPEFAYNVYFTVTFCFSRLGLVDKNIIHSESLRSSQVMETLAQLIFSASLGVNIFLFYKLNKNFRSSLRARFYS
nr:G protein-coupled receptor [Proales similis]